MAAELEQQLARLKLGDHVCPIHDGAAERLAVSVPYIRIGLERGERCQYIAEESAIEETVRDLAAAGVDVAQERDRGALVLKSFEETPLGSGGLDVRQVVDFLQQAEASALADGFTGLRGLGSSAWMLRAEFDPDQLVNYEALINKAVAGGRMMVLCQYDRPRFDDAFIHDVLRAHPIAILGELVCPNPYYEPPELLANRDRMARVDFKRKRADWWIARLKAVRVAEHRRESAEAAALDRQEHIDLLLNSTAEAIYGMDLQGGCTFANPACARLLGHPDPRALEGLNMHRLMHHSRADGTPYPEEECPIMRALGRGEAAHADDEVLWRADGTPFPAEYWSFPIHRRGRLIGAVVTFLDISERKALEEQVRQSQRMEALGQLTGGIAHDFNNLLTVVLGNADMLAEDLDAGTDQRDQAEVIRSAAERGADLINRMLAFARRQPLHPQIVDVNELIRSMETMLRRSLGEQTEMQLDLAADAWPSLIDPSQLETAILNLAINARDAMPHGGRLVIGTANIRLDAAFCAVNPEAKPGDYVAIGVTDSGAGMSPDVLKLAFQPFFTTKGAGMGTGLGLSMVYGFAKQSDGHIEIASQLGRGTTVTLYLPRAGEAEQKDFGNGHASNVARERGGEVILLVEDDELVRDYVVTQLRGLGYEVIPVADGPAALETLRGRSDIQLLFTDVIMPGGLNGAAVAEQAALIRPGLKVLFTSGYAENVLTHEGRLPEGVRLLAKPYRPRELAAEVRRALDDQGAGAAGQQGSG